MTKLIARALRHIADRIDPKPPKPPLIYESPLPMTEGTAKQLADMISGAVGGRIGISYVRPDGKPARYL